MRKPTPEKIEELLSHEVFVFGSNESGFHGAGAAGLACRGEAANTWREDRWFLQAMKSPVNSAQRIGRWAVYGQAQGFQVGREGQSYAIKTIKKPGLKRSVSLLEITKQVQELVVYAKLNPQLSFLVTKIGSHLAGYSLVEMKGVFLSVGDIPDNILLPKEYEFRD